MQQSVAVCQMLAKKSKAQGGFSEVLIKIWASNRLWNLHKIIKGEGVGWISIWDHCMYSPSVSSPPPPPPPTPKPPPPSSAAPSSQKWDNEPQQRAGGRKLAACCHTWKPNAYYGKAPPPLLFICEHLHTTVTNTNPCTHKHTQTHTNTHTHTHTIESRLTEPHIWVHLPNSVIAAARSAPLQQFFCIHIYMCVCVCVCVCVFVSVCAYKPHIYCEYKHNVYVDNEGGGVALQR